MTHPLDGCWEKIRRANEAIQAFSSEQRNFILSPDAFEMTQEFQNNGLDYVFMIKGNLQVPLRLAVLAGEAVHHLRSSLDWLVCALVSKNNVALTKKHTFPICKKIKDFDSSVKNGCLEGVSAQAESRIRQQQPYHLQTPDDAVLAVLAELNNQDKHRLPLEVAVAAQLGPQLSIGGDNSVEETAETIEKGYVITGFDGLGKFHQVNKAWTKVLSIKLAHPSPSFRANTTINGEIAFKQAGMQNSVPVVPLLSGVSGNVKNFVDAFAGDF